MVSIRNMRSIFTFLSASLAVFLSPSIALAVDMDYYTYGGFYPIVDAFQTVALVFSDDKYDVIFTVVIVVSIVAGIFRGIYTAFLTKNTSLFTWAAPVIVGIAIHQSLIVPTGTLHIYDPMRNKYQAVSGIPNGIIIIAGGFNGIESGLVDMFNTASSVDYKSQAGGIGFDLLLGIGEQGVAMGDSYLRASLLNYTEECVFFELQRAGGGIHMNDLQKNKDFVGIYESASNPAIYTVYFEDDPGTCPDDPGSDFRNSGCALTCTDAWSAIKLQLQNPATFEAGIAQRCADAGFDPEIPADMQACKEKISNLSSWLANTAYTEVDVARQTSMAYAFNDALQSYSPDAAAQVLASRSTSASMIGMGVNAAKWVPVTRAAITAVVVALMPFLIIFLVSPLWPKVSGLIFGFFLLLAAWGVADAVVHNLAMNDAYRVFDTLRKYDLGMETISNMGMMSLKSVAIFSSLRQYGFMIATVIATSLGLFSAYGITSFANNVMSASASGAGAAGQEAYTPEGKGQRVKSLEVYPTAMPNQARYNYKERFDAGVNKGAYEFGRDGAFGNQSTAHDTGQRQTEASVESSFGAMGHAKASNTMSDVAKDKASAEVADWQAFSQTAENHGFYSSREFKKFLSETNYEKAFADTTTMRGFVDEANEMGKDGYKLLADTNMAHSSAIRDAFKGDAEAYKKFQQNNMKLSLGQQEGLARAAQETGVDLKDYSQQTTYMDNLRKVGALEAYQKGEITDKDLVQMGKAGVLTESGMAKAKQTIADRFFDRDMKKAEESLSGIDGMKRVANLQRLETAQEATGAKDLFDVVRGENTTYSGFISKEAAQKFGIGDKDMYGTVALNPDTEKFVYAEGKSGSKIEDLQGKRTDNWTGKYGGMAFTGKGTTRTDTGDNVTISGSNADKNMLKGFADKAESLGDTKSAAQMREMAAKLKPGAAANYEIQGSGDGRVSSISIGQGTDAKKFDLGEEKSKRILDNQDEVSRGTHYNFGNDLMGYIENNDSEGFYKAYGQYFVGNKATTGGIALAAGMADTINKFGDIKQTTQDIFGAGAKESGGVQFDSGKSIWGMVLEKSTGIKFKAGVDGNLDQQRKAIESIDSNILMTYGTKTYTDTMGMNGTSREKADSFLNQMTTVAKELKSHAGRNTVEQMADGVNNPSKGQGLGGF